MYIASHAGIQFIVCVCVSVVCVSIYPHLYLLCDGHPSHFQGIMFQCISEIQCTGTNSRPSCFHQCTCKAVYFFRLSCIQYATINLEAFGSVAFEP